MPIRSKPPIRPSPATSICGSISTLPRGCGSGLRAEGKRGAPSRPALVALSSELLLEAQFDGLRIATVAVAAVEIETDGRHRGNGHVDAGLQNEAVFGDRLARGDEIAATGKGQGRGRFRISESMLPSGSPPDRCVYAGQRHLGPGVERRLQNTFDQRDRVQRPRRQLFAPQIAGPPLAGQVDSAEDIANIVISSVDGTPIRVSHVAQVSLGQELRAGAATENGREVVLGTVFMLIGENSRTVSQAVAAKLVEINRNLPKGVVAVTVSTI